MTEIVSMKRVRSLLFDVDPYENLEQIYAPDLQGWGSQGPAFERGIAVCRIAHAACGRA